MEENDINRLVGIFNKGLFDPFPDGLEEGSDNLPSVEDLIKVQKMFSLATIALKVSNACAHNKHTYTF